jgi:hypothetical protein
MSVTLQEARLGLRRMRKTTDSAGFPQFKNCQNFDKTETNDSSAIGTVAAVFSLTGIDSANPATVVQLVSAK